MKTFIKRLIATIGFLLTLQVAITSVHDFDVAKTGVELFKALFFMFAGTVAAISFAGDFKYKRWPWQL